MYAILTSHVKTHTFLRGDAPTKRHTNMIKRRKRRTANQVVATKYGKLQPFAEASITQHQARMFWCRCDCGVEKKVYLANLVSGQTTSCGSAQCSPGRMQRKYYLAPGDEFGRLTVIREVEDGVFIMPRDGSVAKTKTRGYMCACSCMPIPPKEDWATLDEYNTRYQLIDVRAVLLTSGSTQSCGCLRRDNIKKLNDEQWREDDEN